MFSVKLERLECLRQGCGQVIIVGSLIESSHKQFESE